MTPHRMTSLAYCPYALRSFVTLRWVGSRHTSQLQHDSQPAAALVALVGALQLRTLRAAFRPDRQHCVAETWRDSHVGGVRAPGRDRGGKLPASLKIMSTATDFVADAAQHDQN